MALTSLSDLRDAVERVRAFARRTPVLDLSDLAGRSLILKCEHHQPAGAFKIRGASNAIASLSPDALKRGVITYSSGNHGQAVSLAANRLGIPAVIVMPKTAPQIKVDGVKRYGGEVILEGTTTMERKKRAEDEAVARGLTMIPPFDDAMVIAGQGTCALEIMEQVPDVAAIVVPVGGGGLLSGVASAVKLMKPSIKVIGVEPAGAAKMSASLKAGHPVTLEKTSSIADGLMPVRPGDLTFEHTKAFVDAVITVDDAQIAKAALWLFHEAKQVVEPSGAATTAAILNGLIDSISAPAAGPVVAIVSGGNVSPATLAALSPQ